MLIAVDIGNTNITLGVYEGEELQFVSRLASDRSRTADQYTVEIGSILSFNGACAQAGAAIVSSVVPDLTQAVTTALRSLTGSRPLVVGPGLKTGLNIRTDIPGQLGADLVAGAVGAIQKYPLPCLVVDLGTASKISLIDRTGTYCGCTISPGVGISLNALVNNGSLLPNVFLAMPRHVIGTNSEDCIRSGVVFGTAGMLDGLIDHIEQESRDPIAAIVATGGYAGSIIPCCQHDIVLDDTLLLDGLRAIYLKNSH